MKNTTEQSPTDLINVRLDPSMRDLTGCAMGDFLIERPIGQGGMGKVYLARQISLNRPVAIKVLRPDLCTNPTVLTRFETEAWAAAKLNHPNIVHIYAFSSVDDVRFIAMEYVEGTNLREYISKKKKIELPLALSIMRQAGMAIGAAGENGLIHRDIKPENLLLTRKGLVKIADFGLSRDSENDKIHLTQPGMTMGTPLYMSPEQVQGHELDHRSDLYSLGVTFYHMLAGEPPFTGDNSLAIALKHVKDPPVSLAVHRPDLPPELVDLVHKLMNKKPADRFQTAAEMLRDLGKIREKLALQATTFTGSLPSPSLTTAIATDAGKPAPSLMSLWRRAKPWLKPTPRKRWAATALVIAAGGLFGWLGRKEDLLSAEAPTAPAPAGLWIVPGWADLAPRQPTAEAQFRYALIVAPKESREAAWLAVPGYFRRESDHGWCFKAYAELARELLARHDGKSLEILAKELERSKHPEDQDLAVLVSAAHWVIEADAQAVVKDLKPYANPDAGSVSPSLSSFLLDIVREAREISDIQDENVSSALRTIETRYVNQFLWDRVGTSRR